MQTSIISIKHLISEAECHETIRQLRWPDGVICPHCDSGATLKRGFDGPSGTCSVTRARPAVDASTT